MEKDYRQLLQIPTNRLEAINSVLLDPNSQVMNQFLAVVAKYGTPQEINKKHRAARKMENLFKLVEEKNPAYIKDLNWLIKQRDKGSYYENDNPAPDVGVNTSLNFVTASGAVVLDATLTLSDS